MQSRHRDHKVKQGEIVYFSILGGKYEYEPLKEDIWHLNLCGFLKVTKVSRLITVSPPTNN